MKNLKKKYAKVHPQAAVGIKIINACITNFIIQEKGSTSVYAIEKYTGLKNISIHLVADLLKLMVANDIISIDRVGNIIGEMKTLTESLRQEKVHLPEKHKKLWTNGDYFRLAQLKMSGYSIELIAKNMNRTQQSVSMQATLLRKAYRLISLINENKLVRDFASIQVSPNPAD